MSKLGVKSLLLSGFIFILISFYGCGGGGSGGSNESGDSNQPVVEVDLELDDLQTIPWRVVAVDNLQDMNRVEPDFELEIELHNEKKGNADLLVSILLDIDASSGPSEGDCLLEVKVGSGYQFRVYQDYIVEVDRFRRFTKGDGYTSFGRVEENGIQRLRVGLNFPDQELKDSLENNTLTYQLNIKRQTSDSSADVLSEDYFPESGTAAFLGRYEVDGERDYIGNEASSDIWAVKATNNLY